MRHDVDLVGPQENDPDLELVLVTAGDNARGAFFQGRQHLLRIVPVKLSDEMARFRKDHQDSHLVLGALYAQAGMLTESEAELKKVAPGDPSYKTARALLESLASGSPAEAPKVAP